MHIMHYVIFILKIIFKIDIQVETEKTDNQLSLYTKNESPQESLFIITTNLGK